MSPSISGFFSSFLSTVHADAPEEKQDAPEEKQDEPAAKEASEPQTEAVEEEEPEDVYPAIREECQNLAKCAALAKHFEHCQEKVHSGQGFKGEDCVEELMMHCVDDAAAPKLFAKLR